MKTTTSEAMNRLIRQRLGRTEPEPQPEPVSPNGRGDGGQTGADEDERAGGVHPMTDLIRARLAWRRFVVRERR